MTVITLNRCKFISRKEDSTSHFTSITAVMLHAETNSLAITIVIIIYLLNLLLLVVVPAVVVVITTIRLVYTRALVYFLSKLSYKAIF